MSFNETAATKTYHEGREVVLSAPSWVAAQRALDLIRAGLTVIRSEPMPFDADEQLIAWNEEEPEVKDREAFDAQRTHGLRINSVPMALRGHQVPVQRQALRRVCGRSGPVQVPPPSPAFTFR